MKIEVCLVTSNDNPDYYIFYPYIKPIWEKLLGVKCVLIFIGNELPEILEEYKKDIIMFEPITGIHTAFIAQNIRLLYPCIMNEYENGILISDIDAIPMNKTYFTKNIESYDDSHLINYSFDPKLYAAREHNIPFNVATAKVWKDIFGISNINDITQRIKEWYTKVGVYNFDNKYRSKCIGFHFDQQILFEFLEKWNQKSQKLVLFDLANRKRLYSVGVVKNRNEQIKIKNGEYDDCFFLRPYKKNSIYLNKISELLLQ